MGWSEEDLDECPCYVTSPGAEIDPNAGPPTATPVNFAEQPELPHGFTWNRKDQVGSLFQGTVDVNGLSVRLFSLSADCDYEQHRGHFVMYELAHTRALQFYGAQLLDAWKADPRLIPEFIRKDRKTVFTCSIFRDQIGGLCIARMHWEGDRPVFGHALLDTLFSSNFAFAAVG